MASSCDRHRSRAVPSTDLQQACRILTVLGQLNLPCAQNKSVSQSKCIVALQFTHPAARRRRIEAAMVFTMSIRRGLRRTTLRVRKARATLKTRMACRMKKSLNHQALVQAKRHSSVQVAPSCTPRPLLVVLSIKPDATIKISNIFLPQKDDIK